MSAKDTVNFFPLNEITTYMSLPLGGCLSHCSDHWDTIGASPWVKSTIKNGYKIPFERLPKQKTAPLNPEAKDEAFNILDSEAADLLRKEAVTLSEPESGDFTSFYFAVAKECSPGKFRPI